MRELEERRAAILESIDKQGKLTGELRKRIETCTEKARLEDLYLPFKPKRRTRATIAKERGLEPLADRIWAQAPDGDAGRRGPAFVNAETGVDDVEAALAGARDICAERVADNADVRALVRERFSATGTLRVSKTKEFAEAATKFDTYGSFEEPVASIPSHRFLAIRRGRGREGAARTVEVDFDDRSTAPSG